MKKILILLAFAVIALNTPSTAHAFDLGQIVDPACIFACNNSSKSHKTTTVTRTVYVTPTPTPTPTPTVINNNYNTNNNTTAPAPAPVVAYYPTPTYTYPSYNYNNYPTPLYVSCYSIPTSANTGQTVNWRTSISGGNGNYYTTWSGSENLSGFGSDISKVYYSGGSKYAVVTVTSGGQTISANCGNNVQISEYPNGYNYTNYNYYNQYPYNTYDNYNGNLYVSCSANTTFSPVESNVVWSGYASGGNGYYSYTWSGTDYLNGSGNSLAVTYHSPGVKTATVTVYSGGQSRSQTCSNSVTVGIPNGGNYINYVNTPYPNNYIQTPVVKTVVKEKAPAPTTNDDLTAASLFSLKYVPWGWVAVLVILVLLGSVFYLIFSKRNNL